MQINQDVLLAPYTTLGVGGPARYFTEAATPEEVNDAVAFASDKRVPLFVLGGGSNLVVSDAGWPGLVLKIGIRGISQQDETDRRILFNAGAGEDWDTLVDATVSANCGGLECLSGIPGTVGGTPVQNVGAYGQDVSETIVSVDTLELASGTLRTFSNPECGFAYRTSRFNTVDRGRYVILHVRFAVRRDAPPKITYADLKNHFAGRENAPSLSETREAVRQVRLRKAMLIVEGDDDARSAGSFFKNPVINSRHFEQIEAGAAKRGLTVPKYPADDGHVKVPAAWLVEQSGLHKGFNMGAVGISRKHALAIVNRGGAKASDVIALKEKIQASVREKFGVELQPEPVFLGFDTTG